MVAPTMVGSTAANLRWRASATLVQTQHQRYGLQWYHKCSLWHLRQMSSRVTAYPQFQDWDNTFQEFFSVLRSTFIQLPFPKSWTWSTAVSALCIAPQCCFHYFWARESELLLGIFEMHSPVCQIEMKLQPWRLIKNLPPFSVACWEAGLSHMKLIACFNLLSLASLECTKNSKKHALITGKAIFYSSLVFCTDSPSLNRKPLISIF